ncbi:MAG: tetratricopeptide repeat protein [Phocaeicola plebeius]
MLSDGHCEATIQALQEVLSEARLASDRACEADAYYLLGNACRKMGDWQGALNNYQEAIDRNPEGPAASARSMAMDILNFYNKDMFNQ